MCICGSHVVSLLILLDSSCSCSFSILQSYLYLKYQSRLRTYYLGSYSSAYSASFSYHQFPLYEQYSTTSLHLRSIVHGRWYIVPSAACMYNRGRRRSFCWRSYCGCSDQTRALESKLLLLPITQPPPPTHYDRQQTPRQRFIRRPPRQIRERHTMSATRHRNEYHATLEVAPVITH